MERKKKKKIQNAKNITRIVAKLNTIPIQEINRII